MAGRIVINHFGRDNVFGADDMIVAAVERVVRKRLTAGGTMFIAGTGAPGLGRQRICQVINPATFVAFTYTDLPDTDLDATIDMLQRHIDEHGGIEFDQDDLPIEPR